MKIIELFSGTASFSNIAQERGHQVFTIDFNKQFNPDLCIDILDFDISMLPDEFKHPDFIWASPPCTTFSVASIGKHWNKDKTPKSENAKTGLKIVIKTLQIIKELNPQFWIIENPMGMMRNFLLENRTTVTYCQYGERRMKPTDLWNNFDFIGKRCKNRDNCHDSAPRGSRTGTQGLKNDVERGRIPKALCLEIIKCCEEKYDTIETR